MTRTTLREIQPQRREERRENAKRGQDADSHDYGGIRSVEIGTLMFGAHATMDLVRLAIPRRVYTQSHIDYVVEIILEVWKRREQIRGLKLTYEAPFLRHFTARLEPL